MDRGTPEHVLEEAKKAILDAVNPSRALRPPCAFLTPSIEGNDNTRVQPHHGFRRKGTFQSVGFDQDPGSRIQRLDRARPGDEHQQR